MTSGSWWWIKLLHILAILLSLVGGQKLKQQAYYTSRITLVEDLYFRVMAPQNIAFLYRLRQAKDFGVAFREMYANVALVPTEPSHACSPIENSVLIKDSIALAVRGECSFLTKTLSAQNAGALAVIIADNDEQNDGSMIDMIKDETTRDATIPAAFLLGKDGLMIKRGLIEANMPNAWIHIPVNVTGIPAHQLNRPPWILW